MPSPSDTPRPQAPIIRTLLVVVALLLAMNLVIGGFGGGTLPEAQADNMRSAPLNAAAQRKAIQQEIAGLRKDVQSLQQAMTSRPLDVRVVNPASSSD
ncbi:MAG: hypothetical protein AAF797_09060 [Planctomycetota bacterium]